MPPARPKAWLVSISLMKRAHMEQQNHSTIRSLAKTLFNAHHFHHHHPHYHLRILVRIVTNKMSKLSNRHHSHPHRRPTNNPTMISLTALLFQSPPYTLILFHQRQRVSSNNASYIPLILTLLFRTRSLVLLFSIRIRIRHRLASQRELCHCEVCHAYDS